MGFLNFNNVTGCLGLTRLHIINFILKKMQVIQLDARDKIKFHGQVAEFGTLLYIYYRRKFSSSKKL